MTTCYPGFQSQLKNLLQISALFPQMAQANWCFQKSSLCFKSFSSKFKISGKEGGHDRTEYIFAILWYILEKEYNFIALFLDILLLQRPCRKNKKGLVL